VSKLTREDVELVRDNANEGSVAEAMAFEWLEEHPEDDNEPITAKWLKTQEFLKIDKCLWRAVADAVYLDILAYANGRVFVAVGDGGGSRLSIDLNYIKTRGQLRKLIAALKGE